MKKPYIGPLDKALYDAIKFGEGVAQAYFISETLKQIEDLTKLLDESDLDGPYKKATEMLLEQLENTFYENMTAIHEEDQSGRQNI